MASVPAGSGGIVEETRDLPILIDRAAVKICKLGRVPPSASTYLFDLDRDSSGESDGAAHTIGPVQ